MKEPIREAAMSIPYVKMNGIGNEIVVLDLRGRPETVTAEAARASAGGPPFSDSPRQGSLPPDVLAAGAGFLMLHDPFRRRRRA